MKNGDVDKIYIKLAIFLFSKSSQINLIFEENNRKHFFVSYNINNILWIGE